MNAMSLKPAQCCSYELEVEIAAPRESVWTAIFDDVQSWWLPDFHILGTESTIQFERAPGGRGLIEELPDGTSLQWYTVQMILPREFKVYLAGHIAPDWGGPATSMLQLEVEEIETGCRLRVTDARHGNVDEKQVESSQGGWQQLFGDGLKIFVENR